MRNIFAAAASGVIALAGFAGAANAAVAVSLIWAQTGTNTIGGQAGTPEAVDLSEAITLRVILTAGPEGTLGGVVSVDYTEAVGKTAVVSFANTSGPILNVSLGPATNTGTRIQGINQLALVSPGLTSGQSSQIGTVTFHKDAVGDGTFVIRSDANSVGDGFLDSNGNATTATFGTASLINAPEPGAISLLAMALGALTLAGRGRRS